ncbi:MAG: WD40/YVTN/BNR-like repeat-containing protein [Candidatus Acidiferrales bacterium]
MRILLLILLSTTAADAQSWSVQTSGIDTNLRGVSAAFTRDSNGAAVAGVWASGSNGVILQSRDAGKSWKRLHVEGGETLDFRSIQAFDAKTAYVMSSGEGDKSRIYKTINAGETWKLQYTDKRAAFFLDAMVCISAMQCYAISDPVDGKFLLVATEDGKHWQELPRDNMPAALPGEGAFAASGTCLAIYAKREIYFATGGPAARVFHSPDLGGTWTVVATPIASGNASSGNFSITRQGDEVILVGGDYTDVNRSDRTVAYSLDRGATWTLAASPPRGFRSAVASLDGKTLAAVGPNGEDISDDRGAHWTSIGSLDLNALVVLDGRNAWAVGPKGMVARFIARKN